MEHIDFIGVKPASEKIQIPPYDSQQNLRE